MKRLIPVLVVLAQLACGGDSTTTPTPSGPTSLVIEDTSIGTGAVAATGDTVNVFYTGSFLNGQVFDTNVGRSPLPFRIGASQVIPGFEQGIVGMRVGGKRRLTIPPSLAYGSAGQGPIPPNTTLRFDVELVSIAGK